MNTFPKKKIIRSPVDIVDTRLFSVKLRCMGVHILKNRQGRCLLWSQAMFFAEILR